MNAMKKMIAESCRTCEYISLILAHCHPHTVLTKNQCFATVSASKKNVAPAADWSRKSEARVAIQLKIEKPALDFRTNKAMACWMNNPTITVGLN